MRSHQVAAYSGETGAIRNVRFFFAQLGGEKRFFVMVIT
jgi:hypothetical protein